MKPRHILPFLLVAGLPASVSAQETEIEAPPLEAPAQVVEDYVAEDVPAEAGDAPVALGDPATRIEILVAYTAAARAQAGSTDAMKAAINTYVTLANTAYTNSDANVVMKLVGTTEVTYTESSSMSTDLQRVTGTTDGFMDSIHALRNSTGADLVCLVRRGGAGGAAGVAYLGSASSSFASSAFSVVADDYAAANITFPHEVGHNLGCNHDRDNAGGSSAPGYNYGYRFTGANNVQYRTVMAYAPGTRVAYFSNPSIQYQSRATGIASGQAGAADNAAVTETNTAGTRTFRNGAVRLGTNLVIGDLNNDGRSDLILTDSSTGERHLWGMNNLTRSSTAIFNTVNPVWRLAAVADFNADSKDDLVWENTSTGARTFWLMNGTTQSSAPSIGTVATAWRIVGAGDFNSDGKNDILFENTSNGQHSVWTYNGTTKTGAITLPTVAPPWRVAAVADFNADNKADLVWENMTSGQRVIWLMNGATQTSAVTIATVASPWRIAGARDFNADGKPDIVWENPSNYQRIVWYYDGTTKLGAGTFPNAPSN